MTDRVGAVVEPPSQARVREYYGYYECLEAGWLARGEQESASGERSATRSSSIPGSRFARDALEEFSQRLAVTFADDDNTMIGLWKISYDNVTWAHDLAITYRRALS